MCWRLRVYINTIISNPNPNSHTPQHATHPHVRNQDGALGTADDAANDVPPRTRRVRPALVTCMDGSHVLVHLDVEDLGESRTAGVVKVRGCGFGVCVCVWKGGRLVGFVWVCVGDTQTITNSHKP